MSAAFSPDGKRIVTASQDKTARIWDAATGKPIGEPLKGHEDAVMSAAFSPDGKRIVTASQDKTARIWDAATGKPIGEPLKGHEDAVMSAAFSPDGKRIVTASQDKTARIWDAETGKPIGEPLKGHEVCGLARRSAPTASASSPRLRTRRRGSGTSFPTRRPVSPPRPPSRAAYPGNASLLPCPPSRRLVHRDGEVALQHPRMETVARRRSRRKNPSLPAAR